MIEVNYVDHMGTDLSVVNAAKVSFGARSEWDSEANCPTDPITGGKIPPYNRLTKRDQGLISFLARGCTSGEWDILLDDVTRYGANEERFYRKDEVSLGATERTLLEDLIKYIKRMPAHWSPFAHTAITMNIKMPIFVARQIMKHTTGIEFNEISRRYVDSDPVMYSPPKWRLKAENVKQGSSEEEAAHVTWENESGLEVGGPTGEVVDELNRVCLDMYKKLLNNNVAPEQARMVLPQSMMTEVVMTGNLYALANLYNQRIDPHAQYESQLVAKGVGEVLSKLYPYSFAELTK